MGLMDTLNNLTQQMNNAVDKITNSNAQGIQGAPVNQGLAGLGVVMGNADEAVKEKADYVTSTNMEDGVAKAIYKFLEI